MNPLISVIVPIYNVEKYLRRCVDSIINQTYKNLEIILVDDGSPDNCGKICDGYAEKDERVKVIHKENGGLSDARNAGMKAAAGEYVSFIDSDDWISSDFIDILLGAMLFENSDIADCDVAEVYDYQYGFEFKDSDDINTYDTESGLSMLMAENEFCQHVWNKLYKSEIALKIPFDKGKLNEDEFWTYKAFGQAKRVTKVKRILYFYLQRQGSIMGCDFNIRRLDALEAKAERQEYIEKNFPNLTRQAKLDFFATCIFSCQSAMKYLKGNEKREAKRKIKNYVKDCKPAKNELADFDKKSRFWFNFAAKAFTLCCKVRSITGVGF